MSQHKLIFGIYPGGITLDSETGMFSEIVDNPVAMKRVSEILDQLQPQADPFLVRGYIHYLGSGKHGITTPVDMKQYVTAKRKLDLALCYRTEEDDLKDWDKFIHIIINEYGSALDKIQITEEPNNPDVTSGGDGSFPNVRQAIISGVIAAKDEIQKRGLQIQVGFNAVPSFSPNDEFWNEIRQLGNPNFLDALDYVGLDFYPDVFRPLPAGLTVRDAVTGVLSQFRNVNLASSKISKNVPIHITENGWPTSEIRSEEQQATRIEEVIRAVAQNAEELNITHYEFFDLLDADHTKFTGLQFGLLHDDFSPKPAFEVFRRLIRDL